MPTLDAGESAKIVLGPSESVRVTTGGVASVLSLFGAPAGTTTVPASSRDFGPYDVAASLRITATSGRVDYGTIDASPLTATEIAQTRALVAGAGVDVSFTRDFDGAALGYTLDAGSGQVLPVMRVTVEAATTVIAGARISSGGINTFETTITGASAQGDVIPISVGTSRITRVHVGLSTGTAQTLSGDATVTTNELASWSCLESDDCNAIFVRFSPPRSSGRLCDVTIVGKARA